MNTMYIARRAGHARGFTLIELLVGLVIGLITTAVIAQVLVVSEGRRRTTVSGSDAQVSGAVSLYAVQREVEMSGYGLTAAVSGLGCPIKAERNGADVSAEFGELVPLVITDGASGAPDTIRLMGSAKLSYSVPARVRSNHPRTAANFFVDSTVGAEVGDLMIAVPETIDANNWCSIFNVTNLPGNTQIIHNAGNGGPWNQPGGQTIFPNAGYQAGSYLVNLGQFVRRTISVDPAVGLRFATFNTTTATTTTDEMYPDIVQMQAFYAKDTNADDVVDTFDTVKPTTGAGWQQVKGVRLAIVARSGQMEKEDVTVANPLWDVGSTISVDVSGANPPSVSACGNSKCISIKVDTLPAWQRYRYKVFDSYVPLRNMLWHS